MSDIRELYQEVIIDHGRHPRNFGELTTCNCSKEGFNPLCGDKITVYLTIENDRSKEVMFSGSGCAISMASASLMTQTIKGKTIAEVEYLFGQFHDLLLKDGDGEGLDKLMVLAGVKAYPARVKCATLAWHTLMAAIKNDEAVVSTEV
jgi:nitrogen fixation NifU-like protein